MCILHLQNSLQRLAWGPLSQHTCGGCLSYNRSLVVQGNLDLRLQNNKVPRCLSLLESFAHCHLGRNLSGVASRRVSKKHAGSNSRVMAMEPIGCRAGLPEQTHSGPHHKSTAEHVIPLLLCMQQGGGASAGGVHDCLHERTVQHIRPQRTLMSMQGAIDRSVESADMKPTFQMNRLAPSWQTTSTPLIRNSRPR